MIFDGEQENPTPAEESQAIEEAGEGAEAEAEADAAEVQE